MTVEIAARLVAGVLLILANAFFVATEFGLTRARQFTEAEFVGDDPDDFRGIVYVSAALDQIDALRNEETTLEEIAAPPLTVPVGVSVSDVIDRFQTESQEMALVVSEGEVVGLVTATDAMEAVVGQLEDPLDEGG